MVRPQTNRGTSVFLLDQSGSAFVGGLPVGSKIGVEQSGIRAT